MSPQADALARTFRRSQIQTSLTAAALVRALWERTIDPLNIQESANKWMLLAVPVILRYREQSATSGSLYYRALRALELPDAPQFIPPKAKLMERQFLEKSLWSIGPQKMLDAESKVADGEDPVVQIKMAANQAAGIIEASTIRHTQNGGRATVDQARLADPVAVGYYRETDGDPCFFCAMLASRLGVYKVDSFDQSDPRFEGDGKAKVHDQCACHNRPLFARQDESKFPQSTREAARIWNELPSTYRGAPTSGSNAIRAFRSAYANRHLPVVRAE